MVRSFSCSMVCVRRAGHLGNDKQEALIRRGLHPDVTRDSHLDLRMKRFVRSSPGEGGGRAARYLYIVLTSRSEWLAAYQLCACLTKSLSAGKRCRTAGKARARQKI